jgi:hypothetical protein
MALGIPIRLSFLGLLIAGTATRRRPRLATPKDIIVVGEYKF